LYSQTTHKRINTYFTTYVKDSTTFLWIARGCIVSNRRPHALPDTQTELTDMIGRLAVSCTK